MTTINVNGPPTPIAGLPDAALPLSQDSFIPLDTTQSGPTVRTTLAQLAGFIVSSGLPDSGVVAGTYPVSTITVTSKGIVTGASVDPGTVLAYGTVGTADDTATVQAAITARAGSSVFFPAGTYMVSSLTIPRPGVTLWGTGAASILKQVAGTNANVMTCPFSGSSLYLQGLTIDGNQQNQTNDVSHQFSSVRFSAGSSATPVYFSSVGVNFINGRAKDIFASAPDAAQRVYIYISGCTFLGGIEGASGFGAYYIALQGSTNQIITENTFDFNATPTVAGRAGISNSFASPPATTPAHAVVANNTFRNVGRNVSLANEGAIDYYSGNTDVVISGNRLSTPYGRGIQIKSDAGKVTIVANVINGLGQIGATVIDGQIVVNRSISNAVGGNVVIEGNSCANSTFDGITVTGSSVTGPSFATDCRIAANVVTSATRRGIAVIEFPYAAVDVNTISLCATGVYATPITALLKISGNIIRNCNAAIDARSTVSSAAAELKVTDNIISTTATVSINILYVASVTVQTNHITASTGAVVSVGNTSGIALVVNNAFINSAGITDAGGNANLVDTPNYTSP